MFKKTDPLDISTTRRTKHGSGSKDADEPTEFPPRDVVIDDVERRRAEHSGRIQRWLLWKQRGGGVVAFQFRVSVTRVLSGQPASWESDAVSLRGAGGPQGLHGRGPEEGVQEAGPQVASG